MDRMSVISLPPALFTPSFCNAESSWNLDRWRAPESHKIVTTTGGGSSPRCFFNLRAVLTAATQFTAEDEPKKSPSLRSCQLWLHFTKWFTQLTLESASAPF